MTAFHVVLTIHIVSGAIALLSGLIAATARKRRGRHTLFGEVYHGAYVFVFISAVIMAVEHWTKSSYLFYIAIFSYGLCVFGYVARKRRKKNWLPKHIGGMCGSLIGIITATLVVNAPNIPVLNQVPVLIFWFLPTVIGTPLIIRVGQKYKPRTPRKPQEPQARA